MKRIKNWLGDHWAAYTLAACIAVTLYVFLSHLPPVVSGIRSFLKALSPIFIGIVLAYLIDPIAKFFERTVFSKIKGERKPRILAVTLALICVLAGITLFFVILVPALINSVKDFIGNSDYYYERIQWLIDYINNLKIGIYLNLDALIDSVRSVVNETFVRVTTDFSSFLSSIGSIGSRLLNMVIGFILAAYFLLGKDSLINGLNKLRRTLLTDEKFERNNTFWRRCHEIFISFIGCDLLDGLIVGIANAVFMSMAGMSNIALISLVVGVTNLLPTFGPLIGGIIGTVLILLSSIRHAIYFIIFVIIIQIVDGYIIKPRLFGATLGMSSAWTLVAIIIGGKLFGAMGVIISIPVAAALAVIYREQLLPWLARRKAERTGALPAAESTEGLSENGDDENA